MDKLKRVWAFITSPQFHTALGTILAISAPQFSESVPAVLSAGIAAALTIYSTASGYKNFVKANFAPKLEGVAPVEAPKA